MVLDVFLWKNDFILSTNKKKKQPSEICWKRHLMEEMNVAVLAPNGRWDVDQTVSEKVLQGGCFCASNKFCDGKMNESLRCFSAASTQL